jgi:hypothetical protein
MQCTHMIYNAKINDDIPVNPFILGVKSRNISLSTSNESKDMSSP